MSADNWRICPKCKKVAAEKQAQKEAAKKESYGRVPEEEYLAAIGEANTAALPTDETLREDYEIGIWDGTLQVSYYARCDECGFEVSFQEKKELDI